MFEDVKILTSPDKGVIEKLIMEYDEKWYYKSDFRTDIIYDSFQFSWAYKVNYTVVMVKYKEEPLENAHITISSTEDFTYAIPTDVIKVWGEGELSTVTEQVHSEKWGRSKKGEDTKEEVSTITDSSSVYED